MKKNKKYLNYALFVVFTLFICTGFVSAKTEYIECGNTSFPAPIASITRTVVLLLQIIVPIVIIVVGSLDFLKAVIASDAEAIKKNQKKFLTRIAAGVFTLFIFIVIKAVVSFTADSTNGNTDYASCLSCLISDSGDCGSTTESPFQN